MLPMTRNALYVSETAMRTPFIAIPAVEGSVSSVILVTEKAKCLLGPARSAGIKVR